LVLGVVVPSMSADDFDLSQPELTTDDLLVLDDPRFGPETVAIVTGAASGIGRATTVALAANGLTVVAADIDEAGLDGTVEKAADLDAPGPIHAVPTDLTNDDDVAAMVDAAAEAGDLRYVANIAGMQHIASIPEFPMEKYDLLLDIMLRAPFLVAKLAMPHIREVDGRGAIGNMSSVHGHYATQDKAAYITAKHGLHGLTKSIAAEGGGRLRGFSVSVGYVLTPLMVNQIEDTAEERGISEREVVEDVMLGQARTKEMMTPAEVANLFVFGFSRHGKHLNGGDMLHDGGYSTTYE
jgi:3-hydroxybutyrate dehydrogenase